MSPIPILLSICVAVVCGQKGYDRNSVVQSRYPAFQPRPSFSSGYTSSQPSYPSSYDSVYPSPYQPNYQVSHSGASYGSGYDPVKGEKYTLGQSEYSTFDRNYYQPSITRRRAQILAKTNYPLQERESNFGREVTNFENTSNKLPLFG